jgi:hypothetical protein
MSDGNGELRQLVLAYVTALRENLDRIWQIAQTLPLGVARTDLEMAHQCMIELSLSINKNLTGGC